MKRLLIIVCLFISASITGFCQTKSDSVDNIKYTSDSISGIYIPKDLDDCFGQLNGFWNDSIKNIVKSLTEQEFNARVHFGIGMWIRNNWGLWGDSRLQRYFYEKGVFHPDDMSGIILTSYHRNLTGKKIKLNKQIVETKRYWRESKSENSLPEFTAKTNRYRVFLSIDSALMFCDSIVDIELIRQKRLPQKLSKFKNLKSLTFEDCPDIDFSKTFHNLSGYPYLSELYLFGNKRYDYPSNLGEISQLRKLWVSGDSLTKLPDGIKNLNNLNELNITECPKIILDTLFQLLAEIKSLRELDLSENKLTDIPPSISKLVQLTDLWLDENQLSEIPKGVKSLPNIEYLRLFSNKLSSLNIKPGDLPNLSNIDLCYNNFETFPIELSILNKLERVTIWNSGVSVIPEEITKLRNLKFLNLIGNNLTDDQKEKLKIQLPETVLKL